MISLPNGDILQGDCRETLQSLPEQSVHCLVTSPPYWGLRDYGVNGQIGLEDSMEAFISEMVSVFREVSRVLRDDGTCWLNLGDSYSGGGGYSPDSPSNMSGSMQSNNRGSIGGRIGVPVGLKPKDLCGIPWRVALALQAAGWYLRQDIIWHKPNPMPESCRDRCTKSHEYVFLLTKKPRYWYDAEAIKEPISSKTLTVNTTPRKGSGVESTGEKVNLWMEENGGRYHPSGANKRSVWTVRDDEALLRWLADSHPDVFHEYADSMTVKSDVWTVSTFSYKGAHFATFPPKLIEPCILAGCPEVCCSECGAGHVRILEKKRRPTRPGENTKINGLTGGAYAPPGQTPHGNAREVVGNRDPERHVTETVTVGWEPSCECNAETSPGVVLDPFGGSGTTGEVAKDLGRRFILCELNAEYVKLMRKRLKQGALC